MKDRALWSLGVGVFALMGVVLMLRTSGVLNVQAATATNTVAAPTAFIAAVTPTATVRKPRVRPSLIQPAKPATPGPLTPRVFLPMQLGEYLSEPPPDAPFSVSDRPGNTLGASPQALNLAVTAGIKYARLAVVWGAIEPKKTTPDQFDWTNSDKVLLPLLAQGIQPLALVFVNPSWAATTDCGPVHDPNDLAEFFAALVTRYPTIKYWSLNNEVDGAQYSTLHMSSGGCFGEDDLDGNGIPDYADYAEEARIVWKAVHTANPNAQVVIANLAFDNFTPASQPPGYPGGCCFNYHFLDELLGYMKAHPLPAGDKYGDALGFNDYLTYNLAYWDKHSTAIGVGAKADALKKIESKYGFDFPLVITEMSSWPTNPSAEGVPPETQARQVVQMFAQVLYYRIQVGTWWTWDDYPDTNCNVPVQCELFKYGLVSTSLTPKESYDALRILVNQLRGYQPTDAVINNQYINLGFKLGKVEKRFVYARTDAFSNRTVNVTFPAQQVQVTDMLGNITQRRGNNRGQVTIQVTANPVYVEVNP